MKWTVRTLSALALCLGACACAAPGAAPGDTAAAPPRGSAYWENLKANGSYQRYDYPGPALTGGCVC